MKFALLGLDAETESLARALVEHRSHRVVSIGLEANASRCEPLLDERRAALPPPNHFSQHADALESTVLESGAEAVVVAYDDDAERLLDRVRRLHAIRIPVVLSHPVNLSVLAHYELELLAQDRSARIVPYQPTMRHAAARALVQPLDHSSGWTSVLERLGTIQHITCERQLHDATPSSILRAFTADMVQVQAAAGDVTEVAAMGAAGRGTLALPVDVQMSNPNGVLVRWSATRATDDPETATLSISGSNGSATLEMPSAQPWTLRYRIGDAAEQSLEDSSATSEHNIDAWVQQLDRPADHANQDAQHEITWQPVTRSLELAEGFEKSIRKGRTIHLRYDGRGETDAFKGTMASLGCGLLIAGLFLFVAAAVAMKFAKAEGLTRMNTVLHYLPHAVLGLLVAFLLLQVLRFIIPRDR